MHDLVGIYGRMHSVYRMYLESAFPLRYPAMDRERRRILDTPGVLSQPPLLEPMPLYPSSGLTLAEASAKLPHYEDLKHLGAGLLEDGVRLHAHQWESLKQFLLAGKDIVVTTGTGSGKTECFLLPILAELARESKSWEKPSAPSAERKWWSTPQGDWTPQWAHSRRPSAMRVLILYPLNALVEDQLRRLRSAVDSPRAHSWLDRNRQGNRILFGRYTSQTPVAGDLGQSGRLRTLRERMKNLERTSEQVHQSAVLEPEIKHYFADIDGGEMWSRQDMQFAPPDLFITNYSMLNIMLMRRLETSIFDLTRKWLAESDDNRFTIVVDELHSYIGTPGTEVAYTLRLLLERLDVEPSSDKLRIIATSASIEQDALSRTFLREFFGRDEDRFALISGKQIAPEPNSRTKLRAFRGAFSRFASDLTDCGSAATARGDVISESAQKSMLELADRLGYAGEDDWSPQCTLGDALRQVEAGDAVRDACVSVNRSIRATQVGALGAELFGDNPVLSGSSEGDAMRGLLLALALGKNKDGTSVEQVRGHLFFKHIQKLWACCNPNCDDSRVERPNAGENRPVGAIHTAHRLSCSCGAKVLDLILCQICGEVFLGGCRSVWDSVTILAADQPALEDMPDSDYREKEYRDYGIFWPSVAEPQDKDFTFEKVSYKWERRYLGIYTGEVLRGGDGSVQDLQGWFYICAKKDAGVALPPKCPNCDADFRRRRSFRTPLRHHRPGFQRVSQVLASAFVREMPIKEKDEQARKLIIFTDSRQDAAKLAAGMDLDHYRDMVRVAMIGAHRRFQQLFLGTLRVRLRSPVVSRLIENVNPGLACEIQVAQPEVDKSMVGELRAGNSDFYAQFCDWLDDLGCGDQALAQIMAMIKGYPYLVPMWGIRGIVWRQLLGIGVCPGGTKARALVYNEHPWWKCFSWGDNQGPTRLVNADGTTQSHLQRLMHLLMYEITDSLFPNRVRTLESLGLGYATYLPVHDPDAKTVQCVSAIIRAVCRRHNHYYHPDFVTNSDQFGFPKYCVDYMGCVGANEAHVQRELKESGVAIAGHGSRIGIHPDYLWLCLPDGSLSAPTVEGYRCDTCGSFYLHPAGGYCIECLSELKPGLAADKRDYYRYLAEESGPPFRLHCEELTGQTDLEDRMRRQRWFQEVFLPDEPPSLVAGVDLLSVTTTMEAGVDIGSIQGVMLANMPPRRFNYQQRVGRGGRRGAGLALAVTVCRDRSHDEYYYCRPEEITGAPPPSPYVDVSCEEIITRMLTKEVMRQGFVREGNWQTEQPASDSVHGEFGAAGEWPCNRPAISSYLHSPEAVDKFRRVIRFLVAGTPYQGDAGFADRLLNYIEHDLLEQIDSVASDGSYTQEALSERLANAGLLPMFGFPTRVRWLYTKLPSSGAKWPPPGIVDRDLDLAISVFAPGSQIVKDKEVHTACGVAEFRPAGNTVIVSPGFAPAAGGSDWIIGVCRACKAVLYSDHHSAVDSEMAGAEAVDCLACRKREMRVVKAREPLGFFTDFRPEEFEGTFDWQARATKPSLELGNVEMRAVSGTNLRVCGDKMILTSLNDNGGEGGFRFGEASIRGCRGSGAYAVADSLRKDDDTRIAVVGEGHRIALLCRRPTDVLIMDVLSWPTGVVADPAEVEGRAAWYSFSFMMRIAAASLLDIDPRELQAGFRATTGERNAVGQAFLSDALENGAGYCRWLAESGNLRELLVQSSVGGQGNLASKWLSGPRWGEDRHEEECDTSCHKCLRDYDNMSYHGLLDWRLALDMARIALAEDCAIDTFSDWPGGIRNPWRLLVEGAKAPVLRTMSQLGFRDGGFFNGLPGLVHADRRVVLIMAHPLWTDTNPTWREARLDAERRHEGFTIRTINPFRALRRPTDYLKI